TTTTTANSNVAGKLSASGSTAKELRLPRLNASTRPCSVSSLTTRASIRDSNLAIRRKATQIMLTSGSTPTESQTVLTCAAAIKNTTSASKGTGNHPKTFKTLLRAALRSAHFSVTNAAINGNKIKTPNAMTNSFCTTLVVTSTSRNIHK